MKSSLMLLVSVLAMGSGLGCQEAGAKGTASEAPKAAAVEKISGEAFANKYFKATIPQGWKATTDPKMDFITRIHLSDDGSGMGPCVHVKVEGHGNWPGNPADDVANMAKSQSGTAPEEVAVAGLTFHKTTFGTGVMKQTMYVAKKNGSKITVTLMGREYEGNAMLMRIFQNVEFV